MEELKIIDLHSKERGENYYPIMGGDDRNQTWEEYMSEIKDEYKPHFELVKKAIEDNGWMRITGEDQQRMNITFKFSDGTHWGFSWRAWGDLMQAIVGKREGYMTYYM